MIPHLEAVVLRSGTPSRNAGISMLGITIYAALLTIFGGLMASLVLVSSRSTAESDTINRVGERNRVALFRIAEDVRGAMTDTTVILRSGRGLSFVLPSSLAGTTVVPGPTILYGLTLVDGESANGVDDNGNGLVDEGRLLRRDQSTGETTTICQGLNLTDSQFAKVDDTIVVTLSNSGHMMQADDSYAVSRSLTIRPRN